MVAHSFEKIEKSQEKSSGIEEIFELDFQIKSDNAFNNAGNYEVILENLRINELSTLNFKSNKPQYKKMKLHYEKFLIVFVNFVNVFSSIRKTQNRMWSIQSLNEGLAFSKKCKFNEAIGFFLFFS